MEAAKRQNAQEKTNDENGIVYQQVKSACMACRKSRVKCDKMLPCSRCRRLRIECQPQLRGRGRPPLGAPGAVKSASAKKNDAGLDFIQSIQKQVASGTFLGCSPFQIDELQKKIASDGASLLRPGIVSMGPSVQPNTSQELFRLPGMPSGFQVPTTPVNVNGVGMSLLGQQARFSKPTRVNRPCCCPCEAVIEEFNELMTSSSVNISAARAYLRMWSFLGMQPKVETVKQMISYMSGRLNINVGTFAEGINEDETAKLLSQVTTQFGLRKKWDTTDAAYWERTQVNSCCSYYVNTLWKESFLDEGERTSEDDVNRLSVYFPEADGLELFRAMSKIGLTTGWGGVAVRKILRMYSKSQTQTILALIDAHLYISNDGEFSQLSVRVIPLPQSRHLTFAQGAVFPNSYHTQSGSPNLSPTSSTTALFTGDPSTSLLGPQIAAQKQRSPQISLLDYVPQTFDNGGKKRSWDSVQDFVSKKRMSTPPHT